MKILLASMMAVFLSVPAFQASADRYIDATLAASDSSAATIGYRKVRTRSGHFRDDSVGYFYPKLHEGKSYIFAAACDRDCRDMDLYLYDGQGRLIDSDTSGDDIPVVKSTPAWTDTFKVKVTVADCRNEPCHFKVVSYQQD